MSSRLSRLRAEIRHCNRMRPAFVGFHMSQGCSRPGSIGLRHQTTTTGGNSLIKSKQLL